MILGGGYYSGGSHKAGSDLDSAEILDTQVSPFSWNPDPVMAINKPRVNSTAVLLPDAKVLVIGATIAIREILV